MNFIEWYIIVIISIFTIDIFAKLYRLGKANAKANLEMKDVYVVEYNVWSSWFDIFLLSLLLLIGLKLIFSNVLRAVGVAF